MGDSVPQHAEPISLTDTHPRTRASAEPNRPPAGKTARSTGTVQSSNPCGPGTEARRTHEAGNANDVMAFALKCPAQRPDECNGDSRSREMMKRLSRAEDAIVQLMRELFLDTGADVEDWDVSPNNRAELFSTTSMPTAPSQGVVLAITGGLGRPALG
jgi:hypothetical protein